MEIIRLTSKDLKKLQKYILNENIENTESNLFLFHKNELLKLFKSRDDKYLLNKSYILNRLFYLREHIDMNELVLPNKLVKMSGKNSGYTMDFIRNNTNISLILQSDKVSLEDKLYFVKIIGKILEKVEYNDVLKSVNFHLGDIHEGNFIYDNKENMIKAVDLDSAYVPGMMAPNSKFLTFNDKLWDFPSKYPLDLEDRHIPNYNTTIISYVYILLNYITGEYVPDMCFDDFCNTLNILSDIGFEKELLDSIFNIYLPKDNYLDFELVDSINPKLIYKYKEIKNVKK